MSLTNFSSPYHAATPSSFLYTGHSTVNNLRLNAVLPPAPVPNYDAPESFRNEPYLPPARYQQQQQQHQQRQHQRQRHVDQQRSSEVYVERSSFSSTQDTRYTSYDQDFRRTQPRQQPQQQQQMRPPSPHPSRQQHQERTHEEGSERESAESARISEQEGYPERPNGYTRVNAEGIGGGPDTKTSIHAVLDYDDDFEDYYDDEDQGVPRDAHVTPIQGPIFLKNGSVPVVPLYSYPQLNNGTFVQIPILWTALSVALGVELRGDLVRGAPCIKRYHQLFCPTAGNTYPIERIERFIDENKALMKRMYGDFEMSPSHRTRTRRKRETSSNLKKHDLPDGGPNLRDEEDEFEPGIEVEGDSFFDSISKKRSPRQSFGKNRNNESGRIDACESKVEIVTPYWAHNSAGKLRAIVNTQHFEQAIHQEVCSKTQTNRCTGDCGCEQKYKWHRLLAYDPDNDCKGIFMDWFLFPSCCVCRCDPLNGSGGNSSGNNKFPPATGRN